MLLRKLMRARKAKTCAALINTLLAEKEERLRSPRTLQRTAGTVNRLSSNARLLYNSTGKGGTQTESHNETGTSSTVNLYWLASTDNYRDGHPLLTLAPEYIPAEVSMENLGCTRSLSLSLTDQAADLPLHQRFQQELFLKPIL